MAPPRKSEGRTGVRVGVDRQPGPNLAQQQHALSALLDRLRPRLIDQNMARVYLRSVDWDVDQAYAQWQTDRDDIIYGQTAATLAGLTSDDETDDDEEEEEEETTKPTDDAGVPRGTEGLPSATLEGMLANPISRAFNANIEQERRDAALMLRTHVDNETIGGTMLSPTEAILLLRLSNWDLGLAKASFTTHRAARVRLQRYDRMRTSLPENIDRNQVVITRRQDERLAEFINITGRPDWYSLRMCLEQFNWDLVQAIQFWFLTGVTPVRPAKRLKVDGIRMGINLQLLPWPTEEACQAPTCDEKWGMEPDEYTPEDVESPASDQDADLKVKTPRPTGFLICLDSDRRNTAKKGCPNPTKFLVESIVKGRYWWNRFRRDETLRWPEIEAGGADVADPNLPTFDWNNQQHLDWLNNWHRQALVRATGTHVRLHSQQWSQEEIDFLIQLTEELYQQAKLEHPTYSDEKILPLTIPTVVKMEWEKRMNKKFTGTLQPGSEHLRKDRKATALMTQRGRVQLLVDRYKVTPDKSWFRRIEQRKNAKAEPKTGERRKRSERSPSQEVEAAAETADLEEDKEDKEFETTVATVDTDQGDADVEEEDTANDADDEEG